MGWDGYSTVHRACNGVRILTFVTFHDVLLICALDSELLMRARGAVSTMSVLLLAVTHPTPSLMLGPFDESSFFHPLLAGSIRIPSPSPCFNGIPGLSTYAAEWIVSRVCPFEPHLPGKPGGGKPRPPPGGWKPGGGPPGNPPGGKPGGGPPLPGKPAGGAPGNPGPPTPAAGPCSPEPRPAGLAIPCPACIAEGAPPACAPPPNLAEGSEGGGPSTEHDTTFAPRMIASPSIRFSSVSVIALEPV